MASLSEAVLLEAQKLPEGGLVSPKEFLHLGGRDAVDQAFTRLAKSGELLRVGRGLYTLPVYSRFGMDFPDTDLLVMALEARTGERFAPHGAAEANRLGLSKHVPLREAYLTSGKTRVFRLGSYAVEMKHAPSWQTALGRSLEGALLRALAWLGPNWAPDAMRQARDMVSPDGWKRLRTLVPELPTWLAKTVSEACHG